MCSKQRHSSSERLWCFVKTRRSLSDIQKQWVLDRELSVYKDLPGHEKYEVNGFGVVRNKTGKVEMKERISSSGRYVSVRTEIGIEHLYLKTFMNDLFPNHPFVDQTTEPKPKPKKRRKVASPRRSTRDDDLYWYVPELAGEEWRTVAAYPTMEISNYGRLRSVQKPARYYKPQRVAKDRQRTRYVVGNTAQGTQRRVYLVDLVREAFGNIYTIRYDELLTHEKLRELKEAAERGGMVRAGDTESHI